MYASPSNKNDSEAGFFSINSLKEESKYVVEKKKNSNVMLLRIPFEFITHSIRPLAK